MICKDCIHCDVCHWEGIPPLAERCEDFKDKSRYIEVPCKVGDTIYTVLKSGFIYSAQVVGFHLGKFPTLNGHKRNEYLVCYTNHYLRHIDIAQIGKTVFFAEAEAKMKGGAE